MINKEKERERHRKWREAHKERENERCRKWRMNNPELVKEKQVKYRTRHHEEIKKRAKELYDQNRDHILSVKAAWRVANPEKAKAIKIRCRSNPEYREREKISHKKWLVNNTEKVIKKTAEYNANPENKERMKKIHAAWYKAHPEARSTYEQNRKARKKNVSGSFTAGDIRVMMKRQKKKCVICQVNISDKYHIDHIMPLTLGGSNAPGNLQLLCPTCNMSKYKKHPIAFMQSRGFLV